VPSPGDCSVEQAGCVVTMQRPHRTSGLIGFVLLDALLRGTAAVQPRCTVGKVTMPNTTTASSPGWHRPWSRLCGSVASGATPYEAQVGEAFAVARCPGPRPGGEHGEAPLGQGETGK
jgi:hypothetical protein